MRLELIIDPASIDSYYGNIPDTFNAPNNAVERYVPDFEANDYKDLFDLDFVEPVNSACHSLIDRGDVDYLDASQCEELTLWLKERMKRHCPYPLDVFYPKLLEFSKKAVALGTGIALDL